MEVVVMNEDANQLCTNTLLQIQGDPVNLRDILQARERISCFVHKTPLHRARKLSEALHREVFLKLESLQHTGSFKPRGSFNKLLSLGLEQRRRGVVASTAGNHGIGLSFAAQALDVKAEIHIPKWIDPSKLESLRKYDAHITFFDTVEAARESAKKRAIEENLVFVSAYNDREVIAGGGTIALEIFEQIKKLSSSATLVVPVGGGGLISGIAIAVKMMNPMVRVVGVQAKNSPLMKKWKEAGKPVPYDLQPTIAEGLAVSMERDTITFLPVLKYVDEIILVSEDEIREALKDGFDEGLYMEPSGAASIAATKRLAADSSSADTLIGVVTGRNMSMQRFEELLALI